MAVKVGGRYYLILHAYHHVVADVVEITGKREADVENVHWVYSCVRDWTAFFKDGFCEDTIYHKFPNGSITWIAAFEFNHPWPERSLEAQR